MFSILSKKSRFETLPLALDAIFTMTKFHDLFDFTIYQIYELMGKINILWSFKN